METGVSRAQIINELSKSLHGKLAGYDAIIGKACSADPEFVAHLIAFDFTNGQIKDSKIALPVLTLAHREFPDELTENSVAHLAMQPPRELLKALKFSIEVSAPARRQRLLEKTIRRYLAIREHEPGKWNRLVARHRRSMKSLYSLTHAPMPDWAGNILFKNQYVPGSIFADIAGLSKMPAAQVASTIQKWHLSPLVVSGAMAGSKSAQEDSAVVQATMEQMSDTEVVTRAKSLEKKGIGRDATLKEAFRKKVAKATKSDKATLKTSVAADEVEDEGLKTMLRELQERQIQAQKSAGKGINGDWLVISDKSQSQEMAIDLGKHIAAAIAGFVTGRVWLAFCDGTAAGSEVTGLSLEKIKEGTKFVHASGSTSYGTGLAWAMNHGYQPGGIVIVGDGGENTSPMFAGQYRNYKTKHRADPPVYFYQTFCPPQYADSPGGRPDLFEAAMRVAGIPVTKFDLTHGKVDYFSIPNLVQTMNCSSFGVVEKIMAAPLVTLDQVFGALALAAR